MLRMPCIIRASVFYRKGVRVRLRRPTQRQLLVHITESEMDEEGIKYDGVIAILPDTNTTFRIKATKTLDLEWNGRALVLPCGWV